MFMKMKGSMAEISVEGLDKENRFRIFGRNFFNGSRIQHSKPNRIKGKLRFIPEELIHRTQLAYFSDTPDRMIFISNNDPMNVPILRIDLLFLLFAYA